MSDEDDLLLPRELLAQFDEATRARVIEMRRHAMWDPKKHPRDRKGEFAHTAVGSGQLGLDLGVEKSSKKKDLVGAKLGLDSKGKVVVKEDPDSALKTVDSEVASIEAEVKHHKIEDTKDLSFGAMGQVERVTLDDGQELIHKRQSPENEYGETAGEFKENFGVSPKEANDAEELAPYVSEVFGAGAPAVWRSGKYEMWQQVAPGTMSSDFGYEERSLAMDGDSGRRIALLDAVTNNGDRNGGNWLIDDGKAVPIDHGKAFMTGPYAGGSPFIDAHYGEKLSKAEAASMLAKFDALEPKFKAMNREKWFTQARARLLSITRNGIRNWGTLEDESGGF